MDSTGRYDRNDFEGLTALQAIRRRPAMYLGTDPDLYADKILGLALMDHRRAACTGDLAIEMTIMSDWRFRCEDNGLGMPPFLIDGQNEQDPMEHIPVGAPHQGQLVLVRAFADEITITSSHQGRRWQRQFHDSSASPVRPVDLGPTTASGSTLDVSLAPSRLAHGISPSPSLAEITDDLDDWDSSLARPLDTIELTLSDER